MTEQVAAEHPCVGCGAERGTDLCCTPCWNRVPTNLPGQPHWRTNLRTAKAVSNFNRWDDIHGAVLNWLASHPREKP